LHWKRLKAYWSKKGNLEKALFFKKKIDKLSTLLNSKKSVEIQKKNDDQGGDSDNHKSNDEEPEAVNFGGIPPPPE
jgi:hypothetical protein